MLIAQLSDVHVRPRGQLYKGVADSNRMLSEAISHLHGLDRRPDLVVLTGDLVEDGHPDEYSTALGLLGELTIPYLVIPGNHDDIVWSPFLRCYELVSLNYLIRSLQERRRNRQAEGLGRLQVDHEVELRGLLDGEVSGLGPLEDPIDVGGRSLRHLRKIRAVG